jgi:hypothetical protein
MLLAVAIAYEPALRAPLVWDDHALVQEDSAWRTARIREMMVRPYWPTSALTDVRTTYYRPLVLVAFRIDAMLGGHETEFHFTNLLVHLVACALLAFVAARAGASGGAAVLAALSWGLAPRLTEAVAWISGRTDVFAGAFVLGAMALSPDASAIPRGPSVRAWMRTIASAFCLFFALLSKEVAVAGALALVVAAVWRREGEQAVPRIRRIRAAVGVGVPVVTYAVLRMIALAGVTEHTRALGPAVRAETVLEAVGRYAVMIVDATRPATSIGMIGDPSVPHAGIGGALIIAFVALVVRARRRVPFGVVFGAALAVSALAPVVHVVPFNMNSSVTADRLLYVPLAGVVIVLATVASGLAPRVRLALGSAALCAAVLFAHATNARSLEYCDEPLFWVVAAEHAHPHNTMARNALAGAVRDQGPPELACRLYETSRAVQESSGQTSTLASRRTRENIAGCWARIGRYDESIALYEALTEEFPDAARVWLGLAFARLHVVDLDGALAANARARALDPHLAKITDSLHGTIEIARTETAALATEEDRKKRPWRTARLYTLLGRGPDAERACLAVALDPSATIEERRGAVRDLAANGSVEAARTGVDATASFLFPGEIRNVVRRERRYAQIMRLRSRIEALSEPSSAPR